MTRARNPTAMHDSKMPPEHYLSLIRLEDDYWWHQSRYEAVWEALGRHHTREPGLSVADIGCGTGGFLRFLRARGFRRLTGYDFSGDALEALHRNGIDGRVVDLEKPFDLEQGPADLIVALDVIEHVEGESTFLGNAVENLRPGGLFILTAPGHDFLFSDWDRQLNHFRRYSRRSLHHRLEDAGLAVLESSHLFSFVVPAALWRKGTKRYEAPGSCEFPPVSPGLNALLKRLAGIERRWLRISSLPFGTSVLAVGRKT